MANNNAETIQKRFGNISDKDFKNQVANATACINSLRKGYTTIDPFLDATDLLSTAPGEIDGTTYNLFMSLITNAGAYEEEDLEGVWKTDFTLEEGLLDTVGDGDTYHAAESQYFLERINALPF